jgi:hypothetical protein
MDCSFLINVCDIILRNRLSLVKDSTKPLGEAFQGLRANDGGVYEKVWNII